MERRKGMLENISESAEYSSWKDKLLKLKEKVLQLDWNKRDVVIWGRGRVALFYVNAFKVEAIPIKAYTDNLATSGEVTENFGGGVE